MKKIEMIWRELLFQVYKKKNNRFVQQELANKFKFSTSTIFQALKVPRKMGAVRVGGRDFVLEDPEKLLYHWTSVRNLAKDIFWHTKVNMPVQKIEKNMIPQAVFACYSAYRWRFDDAPADYDTVYVYLNSNKLDVLKKRFPASKSGHTLFVLKADPFLSDYGQTTTIAQTFVDLWNIKRWYAKEYINALRERIDGLLS